MIEKTIEIGGPRQVNWNEIVKSIASVTGQKIIMLPAPFLWLQQLLDYWMGLNGFLLVRINSDLIKGSVCDSESLFKKYDIEPIPFSEKNLKYLGN